jgi:hypothetical protein
MINVKNKYNAGTANNAIMKKKIDEYFTKLKYNSKPTP